MEDLAEGPRGGPGWTFLTNHAHVLICLAGDPTIRLRDVAVRVGITERAVQRIVGELEDEGYLTRDRTGRRNQYEVHADLPLRHPIEKHRTIAALIDIGLQDRKEKRSPSAAPRRPGATGGRRPGK